MSKISPHPWCPRNEATVCGRCSRSKPADGNDWCTSCENENAALALAALRGAPAVHVDHGGWISGGSASDQVRPADLEPHDVIVHDDNQVIVERTRPGGRGWVIWWHDQGTQSGMFDVARTDRITRLGKENTPSHPGRCRLTLAV